MYTNLIFRTNKHNNNFIGLRREGRISNSTKNFQPMSIDKRRAIFFTFTRYFYFEVVENTINANVDIPIDISRR